MESTFSATSESSCRFFFLLYTDCQNNWCGLSMSAAYTVNVFFMVYAEVAGAKMNVLVSVIILGIIAKFQPGFISSIQVFIPLNLWLAPAML